MPSLSRNEIFFKFEEVHIQAGGGLFSGKIPNSLNDSFFNEYFGRTELFEIFYFYLVNHNL